MLQMRHPCLEGHFVHVGSFGGEGGTQIVVALLGRGTARGLALAAAHVAAAGSTGSGRRRTIVVFIAAHVGTGAIAAAIQELDALGLDLGGIAVLAVLVLPLAGLQASSVATLRVATGEPLWV